MDYATWTLVRTGRLYRRPSAPDDPVACELRALAARDRAAGRELADWSDEERERWMGGMEAQRALVAYYNPARWPERIEAPTPWRDELLVIAASVVLAAALEGRVPDTALAAYLLYPAQGAIGGLDRTLRRRSAFRLGLTAETAPRPSTINGGLFFFAATLGQFAWRQYRGNATHRMPWPVFLAMRLIYAVNERRSWNAATRRVAHRRA
ncbi:hypothetical protein OJ998_26060 [Solirubrobacter taibaiensis]|nr:hypothetical protein [Solirubrobacter taibaiensis]